MKPRGRTYTVAILAVATCVVFLFVWLSGGAEEGREATNPEAGAEAGAEGSGSGAGSDALSGLRAGAQAESDTVPEEAPGEAPGEAREETPRPKAREVGQIYSFDASDEAQLVAYSDAVFVGTAERKAGEEPLKSTIPGDEGQPQEQWEVRVGSEEGQILKGGDLNPGGTVTVNVFGGEDPKTGLPLVVVSEGNTPHATDTPVKEGETYVFAVRKNPRLGWLDASAQPDGKVPVESRRELDERLEELRSALEAGAG